MHDMLDPGGGTRRKQGSRKTSLRSEDQKMEDNQPKRLLMEGLESACVIDICASTRLL